MPGEDRAVGFGGAEKRKSGGGDDPRQLPHQEEQRRRVGAEGEGEDGYVLGHAGEGRNLLCKC